MTQKLARKFKNVALIIVVGIGGSNLGTWALQDAVLGKAYNLDRKGKPEILYADTVDPNNIARINNILANTLKKRKKVVINAISKSGGTTETIANFEVFLQTLKKFQKNYKDSVVVTTGTHTNFWHLAHDEGFHILPIPDKVGGRYSVFTPVGLFPLAVIGMNTRKLLDGAAHMRARCLQKRNNPAIIRAAMLAKNRYEGRNIADNFYFDPDLESVGKWYRQLMGESIGKEWNKSHKKRVWMGITPTVSIGSTDLHSMGTTLLRRTKRQILYSRESQPRKSKNCRPKTISVRINSPQHPRKEV